MRRARFQRVQDFMPAIPSLLSSEIAEISSARMPQVNGIYVQMEDEIGSMAAIIGASAAGTKSFTATSGPGISCMQENIGQALAMEIPCVIIDIMRCGPATGLATVPAQGDVMQARWGTHGDHGIIVVSPSSVQECYDLTITAFNLSEKYRTPVIILSDEVIGHLRESYVRWTPKEGDLVSRRVPACDPADYLPFDFKAYEDGIAPLAPFGSGYTTHMTGVIHNEKGYPARGPRADEVVRHLTVKYERNRDDIVITRSYNMEDAEYVVIAYGCSVRPGLAAVESARKQGIKAGLLQLVTIWPFADKEVTEVLKTRKGIVVPELNMGQLRKEKIESYNKFGTKLVGVNRVDTKIIEPIEVLNALKEVAKA